MERYLRASKATCRQNNPELSDPFVGSIREIDISVTSNSLNDVDDQGTGNEIRGKEFTSGLRLRSVLDEYGYQGRQTRDHGRRKVAKVLESMEEDRARIRVLRTREKEREREKLFLSEFSPMIFEYGASRESLER